MPATQAVAVEEYSIDEDYAIDFSQSPTDGRLRALAGKTPTYCVIPSDLSTLERPLRRFFGGDPTIEVLIERRTARERRSASGLRAALFTGRVNGNGGQSPRRDGRVAERRAAQTQVEPPPLPRRFRRHARRLRFLVYGKPGRRTADDAEVQRLVLRIQSGDRSAFEALYTRYFDAIYRYTYVAVRDRHAAEDIAQEVFARILKALPDYEVRESTPFRAWLFRIARNEVLMYQRRERIVEQEDPQVLANMTGALEQSNGHPRHTNGRSSPKAFDWITDSDLIVLVKRLPGPQRQTIALRHLLGLTTNETAFALERSAPAIRQLESRALRFLEDRLTALGRSPAEFGPPEYHRGLVLARTRQAPVLGARRGALAQASPSFAIAAGAGARSR